MSEDQITIEVDGKELSATKGQMLIEVTDANDIYVPRFCYHNKLTIAANCRMCLVEVEKAPKAVPACATPVMDGMKVKTRSKSAVEAQKSIMEFLLINHPLDCPICDQGGECELQDLAMGYGQDVSRYQEKKRVVQDKNIGPLIQTDLTRCIHCTRCVRFGEEVAGLREMGATGRGENMTIGTYIEKSVDSEMSANIIDLCPVGALTSKPFRYSARTWELSQRDTIASHDCVGSNLHAHIKSEKIKRIVPAANESINEVWISDRDRFSYEGLYAEDRLLSPMVKQDGKWQTVDWDVALTEIRNRLSTILSKDGAENVGALASASSTLEELYLLQKLLRSVGSNNIDSRLRQVDISDQEQAPLFPYLGMPIAELEHVHSALLIGSNIRKEQPILNHRLRKAAMKGASVSVINPIRYSFNFDIDETIVTDVSSMIYQCQAVLKALVNETGKTIPENINNQLTNIALTEQHNNIAEELSDRDNSIVLLGSITNAHPQAATLRTLAGLIAELSDSSLGYLSDSANTSGAWLAGALPNRITGGQTSNQVGKSMHEMFESELSAYLLLNIEPELDCWDGSQALQALKQAELVIALTSFETEAMHSYADILLPIAAFAESSGTLINVAGDIQTSTGIAAPSGEARPAWKVLRVLGNQLECEGFDYVASSDVLAEAMKQIGEIKPNNMGAWSESINSVTQHSGLKRIGDVPMNSVDSICRRASSLQQTGDVADGKLHLNNKTASSLKIKDGQVAIVEHDENKVSLPVKIDDRIADDCVNIHAAHETVIALPQFANVKVSGS